MKKPKTSEIETFDIARKAYPSVKRGLNTEFDYFCKHKDWKQALPLLKPAIDEQIERRRLDAQANRFVPPWKHLKTWLYNRCWEETEGVTESPEEKAVKEKQERERKKQKDRDDFQRYLESKSTPALLDIKKDGGYLPGLCGWLIDEILQNRQRKELGVK